MGCQPTVSADGKLPRTFIYCFHVHLRSLRSGRSTQVRKPTLRCYRLRRPHAGARSHLKTCNARSPHLSLAHVFTIPFPARLPSSLTLQKAARATHKTPWTAQTGSKILIGSLVRAEIFQFVPCRLFEATHKSVTCPYFGTQIDTLEFSDIILFTSFTRKIQGCLNKTAARESQNVSRMR